MSWNDRNCFQQSSHNLKVSRKRNEYEMVKRHFSKKKMMSCFATQCGPQTDNREIIKLQYLKAHPQTH